MASDGLGKIKNKKSKDVGKPYDRPKSLLGRVGSTLKDFLTPSWFRESSWESADVVPNDKEKEDKVQEEEEAVMEATEDQTDEAPTSESVRDQWRQGPSSDLAESSVKATNAGIVVECGGFQATFDPSILAEDRNLAPSIEQLSSISRPPLSSACGDSTSILPCSEMQPSTSRGSSGLFSINYSLTAKRSAPPHSGDDSSSDASETIRPENVGAPLKKRCIERNNMQTAFVVQPDEEPVKETSCRKAPGGTQTYLWRTNVNQSSASGSGSVSRPAPSAATTATASGKKPGFDLATFCDMLNHSEQGQQDSSTLNTSYRQSPFYKGKTTYGGASARSKRVNFGQDYQVVPSVRHEVKKVEPAANVSNQVTLSVTAQRILQGLNKNDDAAVSSFNSSLADSPLSFTPSAYKRNSLQASGSKTQLTLKAGPPVHELTTPTFAVIKQSIQTYQSRQPDETVVRWTENADQNVAKSSTKAPVTYNLPSAAPSTQAPGKMRREQTRKHYSNRTAEKEDETPMVVDLPTIPLPVTNIQPFTSSTLPPSSAGFFGISSGKTEQKTAMTFTFSSPIQRSTDSEASKDVQPKSFRFCSPIAVDDHHSNGISTSSFSQQPSASSSAAATSQPASRSSLAFKFNPNAAVKKALPVSETSSLGFAPASELKQGSVMDILGRPPNSSKMTNLTSSSAVAPVTKPVSSAAGAVSDKKPLSELFKVPTNKWLCPGCSVWNNDDVTTCPCCCESKPAAKPAAPAPTVSAAQVSLPVSGTSTLKPLSEIFKPSGDTWKCPECLTRHGNSHIECPCCGTKKLGGSKTDNQPSTNSVVLTPDASSKPKEEPTKKNEVPISSGVGSLSSLFKKPPGEWVCSTCLVSNKADQLKCCACEEPKPGAKTAPSNGAISPAPTTAPSGGQVEAQGFQFNPAAFGSTSAGQSVVKAPSTTDGCGIAPGGGFKMSVPSGGFSGFGSSGFSAPQSSTDKQGSVSISGGFKPTGFGNFGQMPSSDANGSSTKPETVSVLPSGSSTVAKSDNSSVTPSFTGMPFGSTASGGFSFKPNVESETSSKPAPVGLAFGSSSISSVGSDKNVENTGGVLLRPPLRVSEDKSNENFKINKETNVGSSSQNNYVEQHNSSQSTTGIFGSTSTAFDGTKFALPVTSTPFSFGVQASTTVVSTPTPLFGLTKPSTDVSAPKFNFAPTPGSAAVPLTGFGASSTSSAIGVTQPVYSAPSSITSASVAPPPVSASGGFFAPPAMSVNKPVAQEVAKPSLFNFGQNPSDAVPSLFKFGQTPQTVKEEVKPAASNLFQFGQQSQITASTNLFQFGASASTTVSGAGIFNSTVTQPCAPSAVFGQPPATAPGTFNFGASTGAQTNSANQFAFGAKPPDAVSKPDVMPSFSQLGNKRSMDDDGVASKRGRSGSEDMPMQDVEPMQSPKQTSVGFPFNPQQSGFAFNTPQASASVNNPGFFGAKSANPVPFGNPSATGTSSFTFTGQQQQPVPAPGFGNQNISNMANGGTNTGFAFGTGSTAPPAPGGFSFSSTPNFNFANTSSNPGGNITFSAQPPAAPPAGRPIKKAVRRTNLRK